MSRKRIFIAILLITVKLGIPVYAQVGKTDDKRFITYIADPKKQDVRFYWKNNKQEIFRSIQNLKTWLGQKHRKLVFAMNGGMYKPDNSPQGLFIENKMVVATLDTAVGNGNFYLIPNGIFYLTTNHLAVICKTTAFANYGNIRFATQSGPMLVIDGDIHPAFKQGSPNRNIRNGVGILPDNTIIFAMSKEEINFYDFAAYFQHMGCKNALYLDGLVSRTYLPDQKWVQTDGNFGVIIGVTIKGN
ncbi:MAG TPA: phosphodiester glycosidase family protein [Chitinophagaceae bacterium]|nr:phosphodiester glycosidase family protein [Chitinophagaceae bacterium]